MEKIQEVLFYKSKYKLLIIINSYIHPNLYSLLPK